MQYAEITCKHSTTRMCRSCRMDVEPASFGAHMDVEPASLGCTHLVWVPNVDVRGLRLSPSTTLMLTLMLSLTPSSCPSRSGHRSNLTHVHPGQAIGPAMA